MAHPEDIRSLLRAFKKGNRMAFSNLIQLYSGKVVSFCYKFVKSREEAQELAQDVFVKVWLHKESIDVRQNFDAYIFTIAKNLCVNYLQSAAYTRQSRELLVHNYKMLIATREETYQFDEYLQLAHQAIENLPDRRREIYRLSKEEGLTQEEIATYLGISKNTVKDQLFKAVKSIKEYLKLHAGITLLLSLLLEL